MRQERTIDAILRRLYNDDDEGRREIVLLADEVGLGKTFVALGVAWSVLRQRSVAGLSTGPVLVVTPHAHALFAKWKREAEQFLLHVAPPDNGFEVETAETPHDLVRKLRKRKPTLVIARMSAFSGRLHRLDTARMAVIHSLLRMDGFDLSMQKRLEMLSDCQSQSFCPTREKLDLRRSSVAWQEARSADEVGFDNHHIRSAWSRLEFADRRLCDRMKDSWNRVRSGHSKRSSYWVDLREICRTALGQTVPHSVPLVIVDEIHNWKNHPTSWWRFLHTLGLRIDRLLGLSATPFQLRPHELVRVLDLRCCIGLSEERMVFLNERIRTLDVQLQAAKAAGESLRSVWAEVEERDMNELEQAWDENGERGWSDHLPPRLRRAVKALVRVRDTQKQLSMSLNPFLLRHLRDVSHRAWWVGREADPESSERPTRESVLRWRPGLDVSGDAELVHYLMMRAVQEEKGGRGSTSLGADLGGSYAFFRKGELRRMLPGSNEEARRYLGLVERAIRGGGHEHPKVAVTAERAFRAWRKGDKTLVFCFNIETVKAVRNAVKRRVDTYNTKVLTAAFECTEDKLEQRLKNFQKRLYNYRQSVFLLFQDHPLAGPKLRVPQGLALRGRGIADVAVRLALSGPPRNRSQFSRRRVLAAAEQVLVDRWKEFSRGQQQINDVVGPLRLAETVSASLNLVLAPDWPIRRREVVEGILPKLKSKLLSDHQDIYTAGHYARPEDIDAWKAVLEGRAGQATLSPYLAEPGIEVPSLLTCCHSAALARLPGRLRTLATRMFRRIVRSPGFLARFILDDPNERPSIDDDTADDDWTSLIHKRYQTPSAAGESAQERFDAYLETLRRAVGLEEQISVYEDASRNRDVVARVTGSVANSERDRLFMGFNSPLFPEVLVVTTVGQEGIDLHRECRHVIHHDLPWNPATLEQRTGRVDRIGSKTERLWSHGKQNCPLDVAVPYIAGTYDEHRFRVVHGRAHLFDVVMGGKYEVDGRRIRTAELGEVNKSDTVSEQEPAWAPIPKAIAADLRIHLEAELPVDADTMT